MVKRFLGLLCLCSMIFALFHRGSFYRMISLMTPSPVKPAEVRSLDAGVSSESEVAKLKRLSDLDLCWLQQV